MFPLALAAPKQGIQRTYNAQKYSFFQFLFKSKKRQPDFILFFNNVTLQYNRHFDAN